MNGLRQLFSDVGESARQRWERELSGIRNTASQLAEAAPDVYNGFSRLPYRVLGAPVDLADTVVRPAAAFAGADYGSPVGGSDWMIAQAQEAGLLPPSSGSTAEMAGDVLGGLLDVSPVTEVAMVSRAMRGPRAEIFAGQKAATADLAAMRRAEERLASGDDPAKVWAEEGWFRGPDGQMRFEIDDSQAQLHWSGLNKIDPELEDIHRYGDVGSAVSHSPLSAAYPDIDSIPVIAYQDLPGLRGQYHHQPWEQIDIRAFAGDEQRNRLIDMRKAVDPLLDDPDPILREAAQAQLDEINDSLRRGIYRGGEREAILHELQHAVQSREGFSMGANAELAGKDAYRRALGEVEARAVQRRMDLTPQQRMQRYPLKDYDVPLDELIIRR